MGKRQHFHWVRRLAGDATSVGLSLPIVFSVAALALTLAVGIAAEAVGAADSGERTVPAAGTASADLSTSIEIPALGACCSEDLTCEVVTDQACEVRGGYFVGPETDCAPNPCDDPPECAVSPPSLDFGAVGVTQSRDLTFRITNNGGQFLEGTVTEACFEYSIIGSRDYRLGPRESKIFTARYSPQGEGSSSCGFFLDSDCPDLIAIGEGVTRPVCEVIPSVLDFGAVSVDTERDLIFTLTNRGGGFLRGNVDVDCPEFFLVGPSGYNLAGGASQEFKVRFLPTNVGEESCTIELDGCAEIEALGLGELPPVCVFVPNPVRFDTTFVGESREQVFRMTNGGGGILEGELDLQCEDFELMGDTTYRLAAGDTAVYTVIFEPSRVGGQVCLVNDEEPCEPLPLVGVGAEPPECVLSATSLAFGEVYLGESAVRTLTITNEGVSRLEGVVDVSACVGFSILSEPTYRLAAGESASFDIEFAPTVTGAEACRMQVGERCEEVFLTATGADAPICSVSPPTVSLGDVPLQDAVRTPIVVTNSGAGQLDVDARWICSDPAFRVVGKSVFSLTEGESDTVWTEFQPLGPGTVSCELQLSDRCETVPMTANGIEFPLCSVSPRSLDFGEVPIGLTAEETVVVTNRGTGTLLGFPAIDCAEFELVGAAEFALGPGESESYVVWFTPLEEVVSTCSLDFGAGCAPFEIEGEGQGPLCAIEPPDFNFGTVIPGKTASQTVVLTNRGGGQLTGTWTFDCSSFSIQSEGSSFDLGAGESFQFDVIYAPTAPGQEACEIDLGPCGRWPVEGSGGEPPLCEVTPARIDLVVEQGVPTDVSAVVTNRGEGRLEGMVSADCEFLELTGEDEFSLVANESARIDFILLFETLGSFECDIDLGTACAPLEVNVSVVPQRGACCLLDGSCRVLSEFGCNDINGTSWTASLACEPNPCRPSGPCCLIDGGCRIETAAACPPGVGTYLGDGLSCDPDPCPMAGACCLQSGDCIVTAEERCADLLGFWSAGDECSAAICASLGACCLQDGLCLFVPSDECAEEDGWYLGENVVCPPEPCPPVGACCFADGDCLILSQSLCQSELGVEWQEGASCAVAACEPRGGCCLDDGTCILSTASLCPGRYLGDNVPCSVSACRQIGACCDPTGQCSIALEISCVGTFLGGDTTCDPLPCTSRVGAVRVVRSSDAAVFEVDTNDPRVKDLRAWYRPGGAENFVEAGAFRQDGQQWSSTIAQADYSIRGVEYYLQYVDTQLGLIVFQGSEDQPRRIVLEDEVPAPPTDANQFQLLSVPADISGPSLGNWLTDRFGEPSRSTWRLGWWDPIARRYLEHSSDLRIPDSVGRGYWLAFSEPTEWRIAGTTRYPRSGEDFYRIRLTPGWNMIGNPAAYPISVAEGDVFVEDGSQVLPLAAVRPSLVGEILSFDPSSEGFLSPYEVEEDALNPWEGAWVENRSEREIVLLLPAVEVPPGFRGESAGGEVAARGNETTGRGTSAQNGETTSEVIDRRKSDDAELLLQFVARSEGETARADWRTDPAADFALDEFDIASPPQAPGRTLSLRWTDRLGDWLRVATPAAETEALLRVRADAPTSLEWNVAEARRKEGLRLIAVVRDSDGSLRDVGTPMDLRRVRSLALPAGTHEFRIVNETLPETPSPFDPTRIGIEPNPVRLSTRISLDLPVPTDVRIELIDASGKRVWSTEKQSADAGQHVLVWDGRDQEGRLLPTGTYFLSVRAAGNQTTRKLIVLR